MIKKTMSLSRLEYFSTHLRIINPLLPVTLTPKEIELLANFMSLDGIIASDRFGTTAKKIIKERMKIKAAGISNYMKSLKNKGFIINNEILPILFPNGHEQTYQFKLINNEE